MTDVHHHHPQHAAGSARDPVCGMSVDPDKTPHRAAHAGQDYFFCGNGCRLKFVADPQKYLAPKPTLAAPPKTAIWTCPMHPEVRQSAPGPCPICGMALEPLEPAAGAPNPELTAMSRRFWVSLVLTVRWRRSACSAQLGRPRPGSSSRWRRRWCCGRRAVLPARLGVDHEPPSQHVHLDRARHRHRLSRQRRVARAAAGKLFRGVVGGRDPGAAGPGARAQGAPENRRRDPRAARSRAQIRAAHRRERRDRRAPRRGACGRPAAGEARRENPGGRHRARRRERGGRGDADRRGDCRS